MARVEQIKVTLPTEKTKPAGSLSAFSTLLYGHEKIGKTTLAGEFPDAFFMFCEPGGKDLKLHARSIPDWRTFKAYMAELDKHPKRFQTVVVDTVDLAYKFCEEYTCAKLGIDHPSDEDWGKGWGAVRKEFELAMARLVGAHRGILFVSHAKEVTLKKRGGGEVTKTIPSMSNAARTIIEPMVDIWVAYEYGDQGVRQLRVRGNAEIAAGTRLQNHFQNCGDSIPMGDSPAEAFAAFQAAFDNQDSGKPKAKAGNKRTVRRRRTS